MRSAMNRFKLLSGGLAASLMVLVTASAIAQEAGQWTMTGRTPDLQRYSPLTAINKANVKNLKASWTFFTFTLLIAVSGLYRDRKSTRLNSSHTVISYAVFCLKKKKKKYISQT